MLYHENVCSIEDVKRKLEQSRSFGWSWSKEKAEPYRHTAIVLYLDKIPSFTINFRPGKGSGMFEAVFSECDSEKTIEEIKNPGDPNVEYYFPLFEEFDLDSEKAKLKAMQLVVLILSFEPGKYNLFVNNCRDFIEDVKKHVQKHRADSRIDDGTFQRDMAGVLEGDVLRYATAFTGATVLFAALMRAIFGSDEKEGEKK